MFKVEADASIWLFLPFKKTHTTKKLHQPAHWTLICVKWSIPQLTETPRLLKHGPGLPLPFPQLAHQPSSSCPGHRTRNSAVPTLSTEPTRPLYILQDHPNTTEGWLDLFTHHCCSEPRATAWHPRAPLGVSKPWHPPPLSSPRASSSSHPRNKCDWSCTTALKSAVSFLSPNHEIVRTVRFWGIKKCSQAVSTSPQSTWGPCKDWIPKIITFWVTVLNCHRKTPQVLNPFIKLWAGLTDLNSLCPVCPIALSCPTTLRRFQILWKGSVLFAIWRLKSQVCCLIVQRGFHLLFGKDLMFLQKYLTRIMLSFSQFSSSIILCDL